MKKFLLLFMVVSCSFGQNPADVDPTFNNPNESGFAQPSDVVNSVICSSTLFGKIYLGGFFSSYFGTTANNIVCININGGVDTSFITGIGFNNSVNCLINAPNGKIMVGGNFTNYNGINSNRIILLNSDGSIDNTFLTGSGFNGKVLSIAVQTDGKFIIGGDFTTYNGTPVSKIVRLNNNGSVDSSFLTGTGFNNSVKSIAIQTDGKILIGGSFTLFNGISKNRIVRLNNNGPIDTSYVTTIGFNNNVNTIAILSDGKALIGGDFTTYKDVLANRIIKLNTDGTTNNTVFGAGFNSSVFTLALLSDGKVLIGGNFTDFNNKTLNRIMRLNVDGTLDSTFRGNVSNNSIFSIASNNSTIVIGGNFDSTVNTVSGTLNSNRIRVLNDDGSYLSPFADKVGIYSDSSVLPEVMAVAIKPDGKILVGGNSKTYNNSITNGIVLLDNNGYVDSSFSSGSGFTGSFSYIDCIVPQPDGKILVSGYFISYNDVKSTKYLVRLNSNGNIDNSFSTSSLQNNSGYVICLQADGKILLGEKNYTYYNGVPETHIIRLNSDGTIDNSFVSGSGFDLGITSIVQQPDGKILIGGSFSKYKGILANKIIRLNTDGSLDTSFVTGNGFDNLVYNIAIQSDNKILVGGNFMNYNGSVAKRMIRLNTNGSLDNSFTVSGTGFDKLVRKIKLQANGKILVGGSFTTYDGSIVNNLIRLNNDGTKDNSFLTETNPNNTISGSYVNDIAIQNDGKFLIAGSMFRSIDGGGHSLVRLSGEILSSPILIPIVNFTSSTTTVNSNGSIAFTDSSTNTPTAWAWEVSRTGSTTLTSSLQNPTFTFVDAGIYTVKLTASNSAGSNTKTVTNMITVTSPAQIISLPSDNFTVESKSESCLGKNNGEINITAKATYSYMATINGQNYPFVNNSLKVSNLVPGVYNVSITVPGETFEQNFTINISKGATITGKSSIASDKVNVEIAQGTAPYTVFVDGVKQFETTDSRFSVETKKGGLLEVKTAKACEGTYTEDIAGIEGAVTVHPNPTLGNFEIELPTSKEKVAIALYTLNGTLISNKIYTLENRKAQLTLENQTAGVYIAKIELSTSVYLRIIKK